MLLVLMYRDTEGGILREGFFFFMHFNTFYGKENTGYLNFLNSGVINVNLSLIAQMFCDTHVHGLSDQ